ncbi:NACHT domain-containing protein [Rhodobacter aestuarii]|uniref:NACHT domain-containing protein n=1 Tax=Rhodobacter aestuarii TaxID=453582 RepID=A0A1N7MCU5_9RHOB|nr:NACHT domain-containing protein [Rhodobacter aestuarii]PTV95004.1 NACHT domain-containing protein [Rhodobacter aestuarii]SIS83975.1 NACHT domain-containing protein [Rhodobacter aestuarii]
MGHNYKPTAITRVGFAYQDLVAAETLLDFYRNPQKYSWVQVEASDESFRAVDDVVACLADGRFEVTQVKFAVDPNNPKTALDWEWLLAAKPTGRSLLQHWAAPVLKILDDGLLANARLKTDRKPDAEFYKSLKGSRVVYSKIPLTIRTRIIAQLGSTAGAQKFFKNFDFIHSQPILEDLEATLWARIASDTDSAGWALFQKQLQLWATQKNWPGPDGRIRYIHLQQAFSPERARPLPQDFTVPEDYCVPDESFSDDFFLRVLNDDGVTVLWAPPGRGKSTFLSHFKSKLDAKKVVCIRHHYFLSLDDRSEGRFHFQAIARSLEAQLQEAMPDLRVRRNSTLGETIEQAARKVVAEGRRLIVIIDGLDHVWREGRDREHAEELFNALIPVVPGTHLVVGTQKIAEKDLPTRMLVAAPMEGWVELPLMNRAAVEGWIATQHRAGRLNLFRWPHQSKAKALAAVSDAFFGISKGLPLHLIYSFEAVARAGNEVTPDLVRAQPACPSGDIRDYYAGLMLQLSPRGKAILHVLAGLDFSPPPFALNNCFGVDDQSILGLAEIGHLLDFREMEVRPFHGSLFAFLRDDPSHYSTFMANSAPTLAWLETEAPPYWREAWLWITQATRGNAQNLIKGPSREWALSFVTAGYPIDRLINVLNHAEQAAFEVFDLASVARHRLVKMRAINADELQHDELAQVWYVAAALSGDIFVPAVLRADLSNLPASLIPALVHMTHKSQRGALVDRAVEELNGRITQNRHDEYISNDQQGDFARAVVAVLAASKNNEVARVLRFARGSGQADSILAAFAQSARLVGNVGSVFEAGKSFTGVEFDRELFACLCLEGLSPASPTPLKAGKHPAIRCLGIAKGDAVKGSNSGKDLSALFAGADGPADRHQTDIRGIVYNNFMSALAAALAGKPTKSWVKIPDHASESWLAGAVRAFEKLAQRIAAHWANTKRWPTLGDVFSWYDGQPCYERGYDAQSRFIAVRLALIDAAFDLCLIGRGLDAAYQIDDAVFSEARTSAFWLNELWLEKLTTRRISLHDPASAETFVATYMDELARTVTEFNERASMFGKLALAAHDHNKPQLAAQALRQAVDCLFGYGWRKDAFADDVLTALEMMIEAGDQDAKQTLLALAGAFHRITDYTDGDGTNHIRSEYYTAVARHFPERIAPMLNDLIRAEDWRYAEDLYNELPSLPLAQSVEGVALFSTFIMPNERIAVEKANLALDIATTLRHKVGPNVKHVRKADRYATESHQNSEKENAEAPKPGDFPPGKFSELIAERRRLSLFDISRSTVTEWLNYWDAKGRGVAALADLEAGLSEPRLHLEIESGLDTAAEIAAKLHGRSEAFKWLVRAHIARYGWQRYLTSKDEAEARLELVARDHRARWKDFVRETSKPALNLRESRNGLVIGFTRLIYFLTQVGELELAKAHTKALVDTFMAEIAQQPLDKPSWA